MMLLYAATPYLEGSCKPYVRVQYHYKRCWYHHTPRSVRRGVWDMRRVVDTSLRVGDTHGGDRY
eukprot:3727441-Rhodomonas_salina.2